MAGPRHTAEQITLLEMAMVGYEFQKQQIDEKVRQIHATLAGVRVGAKKSSDRGTKTVSAKVNLKLRRKMSAAGRKRMAAAQKLRWAAYRKQKQQEGGS